MAKAVRGFTGCRHIWQVLSSKYPLPFYSPNFATGSVYVGKDIKKEKEVALKFEHHRESHSDLYHEYKIYKDLAGCPGISRVYWYGIEGPYNVLVIDRHQLSLDDMVSQGTLDPRTVVSFAGQMVSTCFKVQRTCFDKLPSYVPWKLFMFAAMYIVTSSPTTSWLELTI